MRAIDKSVRIRASPTKVFEALTCGSEIPKYWPIKKAEIGSQVGDSVLLRGDDFADRGKITKFKKGEMFEYEYWSTNHGTTETKENQVIISYKLNAEGDGSILMLHQESLPSDELLEQMDGVWDFLLGSLKEYVENKHEKHSAM
jgi:uncharacterized protein YndB with AHSA1/START domain